MILEPTAMRLNRPFKNITLNFSTSRRTHENLIFLLTNDYEDYNKVFTGGLFKPQHLYNVFTPRYIKPYNFNKLIKCNQNEIYDNISKLTNGRLYIGKIQNSSYMDRNLVYNLIPELRNTFDFYLNERKISPIKMHQTLIDFIPKLVNSKIDEIKYEKNYIIFPITKSYKGLLQLISKQGDSGDDRQYEPVVEFVKSIKTGKYKASDYTNVERIFFYAPEYDSLLAINPQDPKLIEDIQLIMMRIVSMSSGIIDSGEGENEPAGLVDPSDIENPNKSDASADVHEIYKEKLKHAVLDNIGKKLKTKLTDYSVASRDEQAIINNIDRKIDKFLSDDANKNKNGNDLINDIEKDKDIVTSAVSYIQTKTANNANMAQLAKNIKDENKVIDSLLDIYDETDSFIEAEKIPVNAELKLNADIQNTTFNNINIEYNKKKLLKDKIAAFSSFSNPENIMPLTIVDMSFTDSSDIFNEKETATVKYKTVDGRVMSVKVDIPKIIDDCFLYIGGNKYIIGKQLLHIPILKTKSDRVEITTDFNKMTLEKTSGAISRRNSYLIKLIETHSKALQISRGDNSEINSKYVNDSELSELSSYYNTIKNNKYSIYFNRKEMDTIINNSKYDVKYIKSTMSPFCIDTDNVLYYIENSEIYSIDLNKADDEKALSGNKVYASMYEFIAKEVLKLSDYKYPTVGHSYVYSKVKFLSVWYPIFIIVGMNIGITQMLRRIKADWKFTKSKHEKSYEYVEIPFKDGYFYFKDTPTNSMLLSVLHTMDTRSYYFTDFDTSEPYATYAVDVLGQPLYTKRMTRINIEKMIDPISYDVLKTMKLPTNIYDLLLLGSSMLVTNDYVSPLEMTGYRVRGNEVIFSVLYSVLSEAYRKYQQAAMNGSKVGMVVKQNAVIATIINLQTVTPSSILNPLKEIEEAGKATPYGFKGINLPEAYKNYEMRLYSDNMRGLLSSGSTPYSGKVGTSRSLTYNPNLTHVRGFIKPLEEDQLNSSNMFSATELLMFGSPTHNDSPRVAMETGQTSNHQMKCVVMNKQLVSTGVNYTIHRLLGKNFIFRAKHSGVVELVDDKNKLAILKYDNGTNDAIDLSTSQAKNTASGFYTPNKLVLKFKQGERFEKDNVIAYNESFFAPAAGEVEYLGGTLAKFALTSNDACYEDACVISERLSKKCASYVTMAKSVALKANCNILKIVSEGDHVGINDILLEYSDAYDDPSTLAFLSKLSAEDAELIGQNQILSKYDGRIADIEVYYNVPFEELSESIQKLIKTVNKSSDARVKILTEKGISASSVKIKNSNAQGKTKIDQKEFEGVMIKFYIEHLDTMQFGDKLTASVANKGTVAQITTIDESAISDFRKDNGETIDLIMSPSGLISRMTYSIFTQMYLNKLLVELGRSINDIINDREPHK